MVRPLAPPASSALPQIRLKRASSLAQAAVASYCRGAMTRRRWLACVFGLLLVCICVFFVARDMLIYRSGVFEAFHASCLRRALALETSAETWIVRQESESLEAAARLLLMGSGLYIDVVVRGELVLSRHDEGFEVEAVDEVQVPPAAPFVLERPGGVAEAWAPFVLAGYPDEAAGFLRIGFSSEYPIEQVRRRVLVASAIGLASLLGVLAVAVGAARWKSRRSGETAADSETLVRCGALSIDLRAREARVADEHLDLTPKLYELLLLFARRPGEVFSDEDLLKTVWAGSPYAASADVKQHIYLLRRKFAAVHPDPKSVIVNVKGFGYRLDPPGDDAQLRSG